MGHEEKITPHSKISIGLILTIIGMVGTTAAFAYNAVNAAFNVQEQRISKLEDNMLIMKADLGYIKAKTNDIDILLRAQK